MGIIGLLASSNFITVNKKIAQEIGLKEAVLLGELASEYEYWKGRNEITDDDYFYSAVSVVQNNTTLSERQQKSALSTLVSMGLVDVSIKGMPAKRHIRINERAVSELFLSENSCSCKTQELVPAKRRNLFLQNAGTCSCKTSEKKEYNNNIYNNLNTNLNTQDTHRVLKTTNVDTNNSYTQETKKYINPLTPTVYVPLLTENHENGEKSGEERPKETIPPSYNPKQKSENNKKTSKQFTPPTLEEVQAYCRERNNNVDAKRFLDYYEAAGWKDQSGKPVKNWKQKMIAVWERPRDENTRYGTTTTTRTRKYGDPDYYGTTDKGYEYL